MREITNQILDFIIIGAQKSASTWLTKSINLHPEIVLPEVEFPCFENEWPHLNDVTGYSSDYIDPPDNSILGIKNNNLLFKPESPAKLSKYNSNIKLICILRDPIERAISAYFWHMWVGMLPIKPLNEGMMDIITSKNKIILDPGFYGAQLKRYLEYFPRDNIHVVLFDELIRDRIKVLNSVFSFLDKDDHIDPGRSDFRSKQTIYSPTRMKWNNLRNSHIYSNTDDPFRVLWIDSSSRSLWSNIVNISVVGIDRLVLSNIINNKKPILNELVRSKLNDIYADDFRLLKTIVNSEFSRWSTFKMIK